MTTGFFGGRDLKSHFFQAKASTFVGLTQSGTNSVNLPPGSQVGDLALFYACENTSSTASGTQAIAAGPAGWNALSGAAVAQIGTTPVFNSRGVWWKKLVQADLDAVSVSFTIGSLGVASACGVLVFRGGNSFTIVSSGGTSGTAVNTVLPAKPAGTKVMVYLLTMRADLNEVIANAGTAPGSSNWTNVYPGAMFAGAFFFRDPNTWVTGEAGRWTWTTTSQGFQHNIAIL